LLARSGKHSYYFTGTPC